MNTMRWILAVALLAAGAGCILISGQIFTTFDLGDIHVTGANGMDSMTVNLSDNQDYMDNRDKLKTLADFAFVGNFTKSAGGALNVEIWITPTSTNYGTATAVRASATRLWGPFVFPADSTIRHIGWTESAALLDSTGKNVLINEVKGDGVFKLYALGATGDYDFRVTHGKLLLTLDVGK
jgi:hypothetical protein